MTPFTVGLACALAFLPSAWLQGATPNESRAALDASFRDEIRPLMAKYCLGCHSTEKHKGDLDLERFHSTADAIRYSKVWQGVVEQVGLGEMPPKEKPQLSDTQRGQLLTWVGQALDEAARENAGDPGPVVLRHLSNAEYGYTVRDLTQVASLDPAKEFPTDSASGEGFMNVGNSLVMSPSWVTKYLDAAKGISRHAVLLPDGLRFSASTTRRDWTEECLNDIRRFYANFTDNGGGLAVNLQGIQFDTKDGGILPLEKYLEALLAERAHAANAAELKRTLSPKYLEIVQQLLNDSKPSILLDPIRRHWRAAKPGDGAALAKEILPWQHTLWRFNPVGHIGKLNGPKAWMEPISPLQPKQEIRLKLAPVAGSDEISVFLNASDAGDGNAGDDVVWERPRLVAAGRPDIAIRDLRDLAAELAEHRTRLLGKTALYLNAAAEAETAAGAASVNDLAQRHSLEAGDLAAWLDYLGIGSGGSVAIEGHFKETYSSSSGYDFIKGWGTGNTPNLAANSSDQHVRVPGNMKPHSVAVHPSPTLDACVGWRSPIAATVRVEIKVQHAHPECGNGVTWSLELRRGITRQRLASGTAQGGNVVKPAPIEKLSILQGDLLSLIIGPRDGNHSCDLTAVDMTISTSGENVRQWDLAADVSPNILEGNPHADRQGNPGVWHFYVEPDKGNPTGPMIPTDSILARWRAGGSPEERSRLAEAVQSLLTAPAVPGTASKGDLALYRQLTSLGSPLLRIPREIRPAASVAANAKPWGLDPALFGRHPNGSAIEAASLCIKAPSLLEIRLPASLAEGREFVTTGTLHPTTGRDGSVQLQALNTRPSPNATLVTGTVDTAGGRGTWTDADKPPTYSTPIVVNNGSDARKRIEASLEEFRNTFPAALCYTKIVPVDEVVTLTLYYREDALLRRLLLTDAQSATLDRLWDQLHFISQDALTLVDAFEQLWQFATQDADPKVFEPMREPIKARALAFRQTMTNAEPSHVEAVLKFANDAYRRPLTAQETAELRQLYKKLRDQEMFHDDAIRLTLARILVSPAFLYRSEKPGPGTAPGPVDGSELATRLSYFLWSSSPDAELRAAAESGRLKDPDVLAAQARRMLKDARVRRLSTEFACAWLHIYDFDQLGEKSERHFPNFAGLRPAMYEETIRFFTDFFQSNGSVLGVLNADHTFVNQDLARHYGFNDLTFKTTNEWRRVEGLQQRARGGVLAQATVLSKQSGAARTSPILRGNWVAEVLLGDKLPKPPKDVPQLPEDEGAVETTMRQITEKHSTDPKCSGCHRRIDPYGFALEAFDATGKKRSEDLGHRPIDTRTKGLDGIEFDGLEGLRGYLLTHRRDAFLMQFCRKLLGYSLGRGVRLTDTPLLNEMRARLKAEDFKVASAVDSIVRSKQFREIRGKEAPTDD